jgi:hypothetical protein
MSGNREGGLKAYKENIRKHGKDYYKRLGAMGGRASGTGGFASLKVGKDGLTGAERAKKWAKIAGSLGKRGAKKQG